MNILTFDIEEWYLEACSSRCSGRYAEYDRYLARILDLLDEHATKATFFCVGEMGRLFPHVVRKIQERGHEIGCHSNIHTWLNQMTEKECREDTHAAVNRLEQCIGQKILSYRAPAFSIGGSNLWAFEILAESGIERDASVFPAKRDFGGFPGFAHQKPTLIKYNGITLKEFPIPMAKVIGLQVAYSGGGYFRFFPLWFIEKEMRRTDYSMCYFHLGDLIPESSKVMNKEAFEEYFKEPGTLKARYTRYFKSNFGKKKAFEKMMTLIQNDKFVNLEQADDSCNWAETHSVFL